MLKRLMRAWRLIALIVTALFITIAGYFVWHAHISATYQTPEESDPYVRFDMEAYDAIVKNYWVASGDYAHFGMPELPQLFSLAAQKVVGVPAPLATSTRSAVATMLADTFKNATSTDAKMHMALDTLQVVLYNLAPTTRDGLLSQKEETALRQNVANINSGSDLYANLGIAKGADATEVNAAYEQKSAALAASTSPAAKAELAQVTHAHEVLGSAVGKALYDQTGAEPSIVSHRYGDTLYLAFNKISPTTLQEFAYAVDAASTTPLTSLILDMRGNVGGQLSFAQGFLGLFLGENQYAFDLYHQGATEPQRTTENKFPELSRFTHIAVLTDSLTQSTAELTTAALKRFKLATVIGTKTRGWGSVEDTYPLATRIDPEATYSLLLVNHLTLRDDQEPIEQNGVIPDIDTAQSGWQKQLPQYVGAGFAATIETRLATTPLR